MVRFDKPCHALHGAVEYFREHLRLGDYLTEGDRTEMTWYGQGAERLGLSGPCDLESFRRLCQGQHPDTGQKLGVREKKDRRLCYFAQISAPKDVSIAHLVAGDTRIAQWWKGAVTDTLQEIEATVATRVRGGGRNTDRTTGNMMAAIVTHDASRALDPQLHTHVVILNLTFDQEENRWKSVQPSGFYHHPGYFREVCYNKLAQRLLEAGYELEPARRVGFTIKGFPPELRDTFSKRREEILRKAHEAGVSSQEALQQITADTRAAKTQATAATLRDRWYTEAGPRLKTIRAIAAATRSTPVQCESPHDALVAAEAHVFERRSVVDQKVLLREALAFGRGRLTLDSLKAELSARASSGALLLHGSLAGSPEALACEQEFVAWAQNQRNRLNPLGDLPADTQVHANQARVITGILNECSGVVILQGDAGTGKTTCLRPIVAGIQNAGSQVFGCAPSAGAADTLRHELTPEADTLQRLLVDEALQAKVRGRVLIVDEAGLMSARQVRDLCHLAERNWNRLLLVGDTKQHASIEAGDALRCLQEYANVPVFHLTEIVRQKDPKYRDAVALLAGGKPDEAFDAFDRLDAVKEISHTPSLLRRAADDFVKTLASGQSCLAISPVWSEIHAFSDEVRARLKSNGTLQGPERTARTVFSLQWTREQLRRLELYQPGDELTFHRDDVRFAKGETVTVLRKEEAALVVCRGDGTETYLSPRHSTAFDVGIAREIPIAIGDRLLLRANNREHRLKNGDLVQIAGFTADGSIQLTDGRTIPADFRQYSHGYAATSHSAQGKTVDRGILIMADAGLAAGNLRQAYVSNSRFRHTQAIYTTSKAEAREAMARPAERRLVMDLERTAAEISTARQAFLAKLFAEGNPAGDLMLRGWDSPPSVAPETKVTGTHG